MASSHSAHSTQSSRSYSRLTRAAYPGRPRHSAPEEQEIVRVAVSNGRVRTRQARSALRTRAVRRAGPAGGRAASGILGGRAVGGPAGGAAGVVGQLVAGLVDRAGRVGTGLGHGLRRVTAHVGDLVGGAPADELAGTGHPL